MTINRHLIKEQVETYAAFLLDGAYDHGSAQEVLQVREELEQVYSLILTNPLLSESLSDIVYSPDQRADLARKVFEGFNAVLVETLAVMASRKEVSLLHRVREVYNTLLEDKLQVCVVDVTTAVELDDRLRNLICEKTSKDLGREVILHENVDSSILGGIVMTAHGKRIDASVLKSLEAARGTLKETDRGGE